MPEVSTIRLGSIASIEMGQSPPSSIVVDGYGGVPFLQGCAEFGPQHPQSRCSCLRPPKVCKEGDVLISVRAPVGTINKADREYCIGRGLAAIRLSADYPKNYGWHLLGYWAPNLRRVEQGTTFKAVSRDDLANLEVFPIAPEDRTSLVSILDAVDETIAKTEGLIAKLKQIKTGLLHDLLTRGLDDNGQLRDPNKHPEQFKDSPVGQIPKDWSCISLKDVADTFAGGTPPRNVSGMFGGTIPWVKSTEVNLRQIASTEESLTERGLRSCSAKWANAGNPLIAMYGATAGTVGWLAIRAVTNQAVLAVVSRHAEISARWLYWVLSFSQWRLFAVIQGSGQPNLSKGIIDGVMVPMPGGANERDEIAAILDNHDNRVIVEEVYLSKLKAIKKGLMHDLLTGSVRVKVQARPTES